MVGDLDAQIAIQILDVYKIKNGEKRKIEWAGVKCDDLQMFFDMM